MIHTLITALIAFAAALALNLAATPLILLVSNRFGWYDRLDHRKIHSGDISRLGGMGIFISFIIASIIPLSMLFNLFSEEKLPWTLTHYLPVFGGIALIHIAGLIDDFTSMRPLFKLLIQVTAGLVVALGGFSIREFIVPFTHIAFPLGIFSIPATVFWMVALSNAINLLDGMDGLAGGIAGIASLFMGLIGLMTGQFGEAILSFALCGALVGFLAFNFPPARLFMGDSGALFLGFVLAVIPLVDKTGTISSYSIIPAVTVLLIPIYDTIAAILRRVKNHRPVSSPDREHLHHKLLDLRLSTKRILLITYGTTIALGVVAVIWSTGPFGAWQLAVLLASWLVIMVLFLMLDKANRVRKAIELPKTEELTKSVVLPEGTEIPVAAQK